MLKRLLLPLFVLVSLAAAGQSGIVNLVFISDLHYGINRPHFRGEDNVSAKTVNAALVKAINALPAAGITQIEAIVVTGDIANREEAGIQPASVSWKEFLADYFEGIRARTATGTKTPLLLTAGNHDASNATGYTRPLYPSRDAGSMAGMLGLMTGQAADTATYQYAKGKLNYSREMAGVHLLFVNIWPDSANRVWIEKDLAAVDSSIPVLLFTHDPPAGDAKHFTSTDGKGENLLEEVLKDSLPGSTLLEQKGLRTFLKRHPNIKAWFHGHNNFCEMYDYTGPANDLKLPVFRSDSPLKGRDSRADETRLSFQLISIDSQHHSLTVKECRWNTQKAAAALEWGIQRSIQL